MRIEKILDMLFEGTGRMRRVTFTDGGKAPFLIALDRAVALGYSPASVRASVEAFIRDSASASGRL
jgi:hypothetical protein